MEERRIRRKCDFRKAIQGRTAWKLVKNNEFAIVKVEQGPMAWVSDELLGSSKCKVMPQFEKNESGSARLD